MTERSKFISISDLLFNIYSNNIEGEITFIYNQLKRSNNNSNIDRITYRKYLDRIKLLLNTIKFYLSSNEFQELNYINNPMDRIKFKNINEKYYSYPNKYSAYEDLTFYKGRLEVLKNRLESIVNPFSKW
jgi:hypothetical protein